jgi:acyl-CoA dehydrogenase
MDFELSEEQRALVETARRIGEKFGVDYWRAKDAAHEFPREMWQAICDAGICGIALPEEVGGSGLGMLDLALAVEALCEGGAGSTLGQIFILNPIFGGVALANFGTPDMRQNLLPRMLRGELNFCMAMTEPDTGSNSLAMKTFAAAEGDGWRLNGRKIWITAVPDSAKMLVICRTRRIEDVSRRTEGISLFMIDTDRSGLTHYPIDKLGTHTLTSSNVYFDNVRIEPHELVGTLHNAWYELLEVLNTERIVATASAVGSGRLAIRLGVDYANQRKVFSDRPIGAYQGLQFPLADAWAQLECARLMNYRAAARCDARMPYGSDANVAKLIAARALAMATERAMHTMGGMGFARESHVERLWRDARLSRFAPVSEEMILNFIAQHDLGMPRSY